MTNNISLRIAYFAMYLFIRRNLDILSNSAVLFNENEDAELSIITIATELAVDPKGNAVSIDAWRLICQELRNKSGLPKYNSIVTEDPGDVHVTATAAYAVLIEFLHGSYFKSIAQDYRSKMVSFMLHENSIKDNHANAWQSWLEAVDEAIRCEHNNNWSTSN